MLSSTPGNVKPIFRTVSKLVLLLGMFRYGNAIIMDGLNAPMRVRQDRLGHENAETTMDYTHAIGEDDRDWQTKSARFFARLCPIRLRLKQLTPSRYNDVALRVFGAKRARYPSGKGEVCKTFIRRFDSAPRLHILPSVSLL